MKGRSPSSALTMLSHALFQCSNNLYDQIEKFDLYHLSYFLKKEKLYLNSPSFFSLIFFYCFLKYTRHGFSHMPTSLVNQHATECIPIWSSSNKINCIIIINKPQKLKSPSQMLHIVNPKIVDVSFPTSRKQEFSCGRFEIQIRRSNQLREAFEHFKLRNQEVMGFIQLRGEFIPNKQELH